MSVLIPRDILAKVLFQNKNRELFVKFLCLNLFMSAILIWAQFNDDRVFSGASAQVLERKKTNDFCHGWRNRRSRNDMCYQDCLNLSAEANDDKRSTFQDYLRNYLLRDNVNIDIFGRGVAGMAT
ncbi:uncharacterized protein [Bemisia tabaci]|uniref:uncharacterized protein isoform X2 n=1 Tax=Bemisia tabaci TaxID=7038 RepID=UPI003B285B57